MVSIFSSTGGNTDLRDGHYSHKPIASFKSLRAAIAWLEENEQYKGYWIKANYNNRWFLMGYMDIEFAKRMLARKDTLKTNSNGYYLTR